jgi:ATP-dependent DNA ligase
MARVRLGFIPPQLPSLTDQPPEGADWIHEVKHDGYRTMLLIERGTALAYTRNGHDWSDRYPGIIAAARKLPCRNAILDGEVIVQDAHGASDFEALQAALRSQPTRLIFYAFDLLHFAIALVEARLGSRPSASLKASLRSLALTATVRPEPNVRSLPSQNMASLSMQDQLSLLYAENHGRISRLGSPDSNRSDQCFHG